MNRKQILILLNFLAAFSVSLCGLTQEHHEEEEHHHHKRNELSIAVGVVPLIQED